VEISLSNTSSQQLGRDLRHHILGFIPRSKPLFQNVPKDANYVYFIVDGRDNSSFSFGFCSVPPSVEH
jgi:hypothetical protein